MSVRPRPDSPAYDADAMFQVPQRAGASLVLKAIYWRQTRDLLSTAGKERRTRKHGSPRASPARLGRGRLPVRAKRFGLIHDQAPRFARFAQESSGKQTADMAL
jgi:hypothetical protein